MGKINHIEQKSYYETSKGRFYLGKSEDVLKSKTLAQLKNKVKLIFTSPPFPLNKKKKYGNLKGKEYIKWLSGFAPLFVDYLSLNGSIVLELGSAWNQGSPTISTLPIETLLKFKEKGRLFLCQEFIYFNPARLPTPVEWVNKERIRVKDSFTRLWWFSPSIRPDADNRRVLMQYSERMKKLLLSSKYNSGRRPSEHNIGKKSFLKDNGGSIPPNVLVSTNTNSKEPYLEYCKRNNLVCHPARMPGEIAEFFIKFLSQEDDWVMDPFAGSNITGATAEKLNRQWISIEVDQNYADGSLGRFIDKRARGEYIGRL